jgi:hypothetical protein
VVAVGFLYACDAPGVVLRATILHSLALFAVAFSLLSVVGPMAIGMGSLSGAIVDAAIMARAIQLRSTSRPLDGLLPTLAVAAVAGAAGAAVLVLSGPGVLTGIAAGLTAAIVYTGVLTLVRRAVMLDTVKLIGEAIRSGLTRERGPAAPAAGTG